jgi:DNA-binding CsgD family transcriptional regulator
VGREAELERVGQLLRRGAGGVVLAGPAGVGKTRLATECLAVAEAAGMPVARAAATRSAARLPFGALAGLLPEDVGAAEDQAIFLRRCCAALAERGDGSRLVLLVDDAHQLDDASAALVHLLVETGSVFVLATLRSGESAPDAVAALWKDGLVERLDLEALPISSVDELLVRVLGNFVERATVSRLAERCQGNALFLRELVLGALQAGALREEGGMWRLERAPPPSDRLGEVIEARLGGLGQDERSFLELLALGEPLGTAEVQALGEEAMVDSLGHRGLLSSALDGRRLEVRLAHPLYGEVLRTRLGPLRTRRLLRTLAETVQGTGARRRGDVLRVATWRLDAGGELPAELMLEAGRQARALFDFGLAERLTHAAIEAGAGFEAQYFLAELLFLQGRYGEAEDLLVGLTPRDDSERARVALMRMDSLGWAGRGEEALVVIFEAEAAVTDPLWLDVITAKRGSLAMVGGFTTVAVELYESVLGRLGPRALVEASFPAATVFGLAGQLEKALAVTERAKVAHRDLGLTHMAWYPAIHDMARAGCLVWAGHLEEGEAIANRVYEEALAEGAVEPRAWAAHNLAMCSRARGRGESAVRWAREATGIVRPLGRTVYFRNLLIALAGALVLAGRLDEAGAVFSEIEALDIPMIRWMEDELLQVRAWAAVGRGDMVAARGLLEEAARTAARSGDFVHESAALHDLARLGHAREVVGRLGELAGIVEGPLAAARAAHAEALVARDPKSLEAASGAFSEIGADLLAAEAAADAAVAWRRAGDPRRAAAAERRAHELADRCEGARTPALAAVGARAVLSPRELDIARLAAAGAGNKEIAERLYLSRKTVENKLTAVYEKLGVTGRDELGSALDEGGRH